MYETKACEGNCLALGHLDSNNFSNTYFHGEYVKVINNEIYRNREELFIKHHKIKYNGQVPIWVVMEITTFGTLSMLFNNLKIEDKKAIGLMCGIHYSMLTSWLKSLAHIRNVCAHYSRIYNKKFTTKPVIPRVYEDYKIDKERIFSIILVIKHSIQNKSEWNSFLTNLKALIDQYEIIDLSLIGFPINWYDILFNNTLLT